MRSELNDEVSMKFSTRQLSFINLCTENFKTPLPLEIHVIIANKLIQPKGNFVAVRRCIINCCNFRASNVNMVMNYVMAILRVIEMELKRIL